MVFNNLPPSLAPVPRLVTTSIRTCPLVISCKRVAYWTTFTYCVKVMIFIITDTGRLLQHDDWSSASPQENHGDLFQYYPLRFSMQSVIKDYWTHSESMCYCPVFETIRFWNSRPPSSSRGSRKGTLDTIVSHQSDVHLLLWELSALNYLNR